MDDIRADRDIGQHNWDASITVGRRYLSAYGKGGGATELKLFDEEMTVFFSPHAAGKSIIFLLALGSPSGRFTSRTL